MAKIRIEGQAGPCVGFIWRMGISKLLGDLRKIDDVTVIFELDDDRQVRLDMSKGEAFCFGDWLIQEAGKAEG